MNARAQDRVEIQALLAAYNAAGDRLQLEALADAFAADGVLEWPTAVARGRDEIIGKLGARPAERDTAEPGPKLVRHHLTTSHVEFDAEGAARGRTYFVVFTEIGPDHAGLYLDDLVKTPAGWRIRHRKVRVDWVAEASLFHALKRAHGARLHGSMT